MAVSRKAMTEGLSKWASSDPLSLVLAGDARDSSPWSARGAFGGQWPPLLILTLLHSKYKARRAAKMRHAFWKGVWEESN